MAKIIDLGNGYGCLKGYPSEESPMIFPLTLTEIRKLYEDGYIDRDETIQAFLTMKYSLEQADLLVAHTDVLIERRRNESVNARTI